MKIKQIGLVTQYIDNPYNEPVIKGIREYFDGRNVRLNLLEVRSPVADASDFEYQYWPLVTFLQSRELDCIILIPGTFASTMSETQIVESMERYLHVPVVSIALDLKFKNCIHTRVDCYSGMKSLFNHLKDEHGCKKIAFMSAEKTSSEEGKARLESYKRILEENKIPFDPDLVIPGNFTRSVSLQVMGEKYPTKESVNFDAIMCANDLMALGVLYHFNKIGIRVPDDVKVCGYDDSSFAEIISPSLTTINQNMEEQGRIAARLAEQLASDEKDSVPKCTDVPVLPVFRESCGCNSFVYDKSRRTEDLEKLMAVSINNVSIYSILDKVQTSRTLSELYTLLKRIFVEVDVSCAGICFYDAPIPLEKGQIFDLPEKVTMTMAFDHRRKDFEFGGNISFNPHENILPVEYFGEDTSFLIFNPIYFGEKQYGYFFYRPGERAFSLYNIYMKIVNDAITLAYAYTEKLMANTELSRQNEELKQHNDALNTASKTDELTKVYNRRGFLFLGQQQINLALQMNSSGLVIFGDMDGLKKINDNYGHESGDIAIQAEANILKRVFRVTDVIGRMGGDEFAVVAAGMKLSAFTRVKNEIEEQCRLWNEENKWPFKLSISLGYAEFDKDNFLLQDLLALADEAQYKEKRQRHAKQGLKEIPGLTSLQKVLDSVKPGHQ